MALPWWMSAAIKAAGAMRLKVVGVPFGMDRQQQWFDERTNIDLDPGDNRPVYYYHGFGERDARSVRRLGKATYVGVGEVGGVRGHLFDVDLDPTHSMAESVYEAAKRGKARASSDSTTHLSRPFGIVGKPGVVTSWPVFGLSLMDEATAGQAINPQAIALAAAKAIQREVKMKEDEEQPKDDEQSKDGEQAQTKPPAADRSRRFMWEEGDLELIRPADKSAEDEDEDDDAEDVEDAEDEDAEDEKQKAAKVIDEVIRRRMGAG